MPFATSSHQAPLTNEQEKIEKSTLLKELAVLRSQVDEAATNKKKLPDLKDKIADKQKELEAVETELAQRTKELVKTSSALVIKDELHDVVSRKVEEKTKVLDEATVAHNSLVKATEQAKKDLSYLLEQQATLENLVHEAKAQHELVIKTHQEQLSTLGAASGDLRETLEQRTNDLVTVNTAIKNAQSELEKILALAKDKQTILDEDVVQLQTKKQSLATEIEQKLKAADVAAQAIITKAEQTAQEKEKALAEREGLASLKEQWTKDVITQGKAVVTALENHYHLKSPIDLKWPE